MTQIGTLHAFDLETGQQKWSMSFEKWHDGIAVFDNNPIVVQEVDGIPNYNFGWNKWSVSQTSFPTCPNHIFTDDPQEFEMNSKIVQNQVNYIYLWFLGTRLF